MLKSKCLKLSLFSKIKHGMGYNLSPPYSLSMFDRSQNRPYFSFCFGVTLPVKAEPLLYYTLSNIRHGTTLDLLIAK